MKNLHTRPMTIGQLSEGTGANVETIRYYERAGLLPPPPRSAGGYRLYGADQLQRLAFIRRSRRLGFSLEEVRSLLRLIDGGDYTCDEVKGMTLTHLEEVRSKIRDLRRLERALRDMVCQCEGGAVPECPIVETLFETPNRRPPA